MKKEILTPSRCREELLYVHKVNILFAIPLMICLFIVALMTVGLVYLTEVRAFDNWKYWDLIFIGGVGGIVVGGVVLLIYLQRHRNRKIERMVLEIVEDTLLFSTMRYEYRGSGRHRHLHIYYVLVFRYFGEYRIPERPHYVWSKLYSADCDKDIYNRAEAGDTYYIVLDRDARRKKPLLIYNTKEFVFCPDGTTEHPDGSWRDSVDVEEYSE